MDRFAMRCVVLNHAVMQRAVVNHAVIGRGMRTRRQLIEPPQESGVA
jgi:hypothetical protein